MNRNPEEGGWPLNPYRMIEEWWGERLSPEIAARIVKAPSKQLRSFDEAYATIVNSLRPPELPAGYMRPAVRSTLVDQISNREPVDITIMLLLYAHEVLLDDPLSAVFHFTDRQSLGNALDTLVRLQPLAEVGAVHFAQLSSRARHPAYWTHFGDPWDMADQLLGSEIPGLERFLSRIGNPARDVVGLLVSEVCSSVALAGNWPGRIQPLAQSEAELFILQSVFSSTAVSLPDLRNIHLRKLSALTVPTLRPDVKQLVAVRRSSDEFARWRTVLAAALAQVQELEESNEYWLENARAIVHAELAPIREAVDTATRRSHALASIRTGMAGFSVAALGAGVGATMGGGKVLPTLAGAGSAKAIETTANYFRKLQDARRGRALLDLALTFREEHEP